MNIEISELSESESSDEWTDSVEDMAATEQTKLIEEVKSYWIENKISAPKVTVYELEKAEQWADWRFKIKSHFMCYQMTVLIETKFCDTVKASADYKTLNGFAVMNLGMNLSPGLRALVGADSEIDAETVWRRLVVQFEGQGTTQAIRCFSKIVRLMSDHGGSLSETIATIREVKAKFDEHKNDGEALWKAILVNAIPSENDVLQTIISTQSVHARTADRANHRDRGAKRRPIAAKSTHHQTRQQRQREERKTPAEMLLLRSKRPLQAQL